MCKKIQKRHAGFQKGYIPWNKGLTKETDKRLLRSEEYKKRISGEGNSFYGKKHSVESKKKISNNRVYLRGKENPNYGKHIWVNKEHPKGMLGKKGYWLGKHRDEETKEKIGRANLGKVVTTAVKLKMSMSHKKNWQDVDFIKKWTKGMQFYKKNVVYPTTPEKALLKIIKKNDIAFEYTGDGVLWINKFNPDFLHKKEKLIIEVFGDYWHNREDIKLRDKERLRNYSKYGYKTLIFWEHELTNKIKNKIPLTEEQIIEKIGDFL